jgi:hypothetical protein
VNISELEAYFENAKTIRGKDASPETWQKMSKYPKDRK